MQKLINAAKRITERSFVRYVFVGGTTFAIDFLLLVLLHEIFGISLIFAATLSYWTSIAFNFTANRLWTFSATPDQFTKNIVLYLLLLALNYGFVIGFISLVTHFGLHYTLAKIIATGIQIAWTYAAYKKAVFK